MKILHTSDWHLGQVFKNLNRYEEHHLFLSFLVKKLQEEHYDLLIIAGDIFDVGTPPTEAVKAYFNFLIQASSTSLKQIVVIAGNHDFASTMEAPQELLNSLSIRVVGLLGQNYLDAIVDITSDSGEKMKVFCAPYIRAGDLKPIEEGESIAGSIRRSIKECYQEGLKLCQADNYEGITIATGHLYAAGSELQDSVRDIHIGREGQVGVESFPPGFDYVALGHIHRAQRVHKQDHIRYSGSPIPLSFSEHSDQKYLIEVTWDKSQKMSIKSLEIPNFRKLIQVKGSRADIYAKLATISEEDKNEQRLQSWVEVVLPEEVPDPHLADEIRAYAEEYQVRVFGISMLKGHLRSNLGEQKNLHLLEPRDVFDLIVQERKDEKDLLKTFQELEIRFREDT